LTVYDIKYLYAPFASHCHATKFNCTRPIPVAALIANGSEFTYSVLEPGTRLLEPRYSHSISV